MICILNGHKSEVTGYAVLALFTHYLMLKPISELSANETFGFPSAEVLSLDA